MEKSLGKWSRRRTAPGDGDGGDAAGLGDPDDAGFGVAPAVEDLRELRALSGASLADDHHHRILLDRLGDLLFELDYGEVRE